MSRRKQTVPCRVQETFSLQFSGNNFLKDKKTDEELDPTIRNSSGSNTSSNSSLTAADSSFELWNTINAMLPKENGKNEDAFDLAGNDVETGNPMNLCKGRELMAENNVEEESHEDKSNCDEEEISCPICNRTFSSEQRLLVHVEIHSIHELNCFTCNLNFSSRSAFVSHHMSHQSKSTDITEVSENNSSCASPVFQKFKLFSGFNDLSFVDFSCDKFSIISEHVCSEVFHRLTDRDSKHFFLCKACDRLFPTLSSLQCHLEKHDEIRKNSVPCDETKKSPSKNLGCLKEVDADEIVVPELLGLKAIKDCPDKKLDKTLLTYSMDSEEVKTSPDLASLNVPSWMKTSITDDCYYDTEISRESSDERPPLKLKLVRRRTTGDEEAHLLVPSQYFIEDESDVLSNGWDNDVLEKDKKEATKVNCDTCGDTFQSEGALTGHRASSVCGIGVGSSSNGRRMYWCRLCNYVSCEKSTILRHQRTHTGLRPYSCKFCDIAFTTKANCERHIRKRHRLRVSGDDEVKKSVFCDYDLLRKARDGEINVPPNATFSNPGGKYFHFICRICKAAFSSRSNGARHVMTKHSIMNRKKANEIIVCNRAPSVKPSTTIRKSPPRQDCVSYKPEERNDSSVVPLLNKKNKENSTVKIPQLIPLAKIRAHYKASLLLAEKFKTEYDEIFQAINRMQQDGSSLSNKLLSLIGSASAVIKKNPRSSFTPVDAFNPSPSFASNSNQDDQPHSNYQLSNEYDKNDDSDNNQSLFDGEELAGFTNERFHNDNLSTPSSPSESPFPWKTATNSSSVLLRHFAARSSKQDENSLRDGIKEGNTENIDNTTDLSSVGELMNFLKTPTVLNLHRDSNLKITHKSTARPSSGSDRMVDAATKRSVSNRFQSFSLFDKRRYGWSNPNFSNRLRDENGRFTRDPNSPKPRFPKIKPAPSIVPYRDHSDLPTMVPGGKVDLNGLKSMSKKGTVFDCGVVGKTRKCPKCDKVFPWASSLSRHIMTHSGLKPYMCAKCSMRFTTRSNLLRHAYRRHNVVRGSNDRQNVLLTVPLNEQKKHAEKEAQQMVELREAEAQRIAEVENQQDKQDSAALYSDELDKSDSTLKEVNDEEINHYNKRYMCGLCKLPFANRSNLVRHLHRLHQITKDDPEFRSLLIKLQTTKAIKFKLSQHPRGFLPIKPADFRSKSDLASSELDGKSTSPTSASPSLLNGIVNDVNVGKRKPFTCSICYIGFTKRNNAARHIQHQHNISRKNATFHQLIIRNDIPLANKSKVKKENQVEVISEPSLVEVDDEKQEGGNDVEEIMQDNELSMVNKSNQKDEGESCSPIPASSLETNIAKPSSSTNNRRRVMTWKKMEQDTGDDFDQFASVRPPPKKRDIRLTHFICGVCKRIFKEVSDLKLHLEEHNIPHPWHCTICGVPFTNKYNCQRHLMRRHGTADLEPKYVEDLRHGPPQPRKRSKGSNRRRNANNSSKVKTEPVN